MEHQELVVEPYPERAVDFAEYRPVLEEVFAKIKRSVRGHRGDWHNYSDAQVFEAVAGEFDEYREAYVAGELRGRHGQVDELFDVAVTAIKGIVRLRGLDHGDD